MLKVIEFVLVQETVALAIDGPGLANNFHQLHIRVSFVHLGKFYQSICALQLIEELVPDLTSFLLFVHFHTLRHIVLQHFLTIVGDVGVADRQSHVNGMKIDVEIVQDFAHIASLNFLLVLARSRILRLKTKNSYKWLLPERVGYLFGNFGHNHYVILFTLLLDHILCSLVPIFNFVFLFFVLAAL